MNRTKRRRGKYLLLPALLIAMLLFGACAAQPAENEEPADTAVTEESRTDDETVLTEESRTDDETALAEESPESAPDESGTYTSKEDVAAYLNAYGHLPSNFITKKEAKALGWVNTEGNLADVAPGKSIGGDYFGNYEGILPDKKGREYHECDIDSRNGRRGAKRIVYSNDGLIYYTEDHYETFELLYGEE